MKPHSFSQKHDHIVWLQVPGLSAEHLAMLRFGSDSADQTTALEKSQCLGNSWHFNLFELRPSAENSFMSQVTGRKSIVGDCSDYKLPPIWQYLDRIDYVSGIFEAEGGSSYLKSLKCHGEQAFLQDVYFWKMGKRLEEVPPLYFTHIDQEVFSTPGIYFDDACQTGVCFASAFSNVQSVYSRFIQGKGKTLFIYRDASIIKALRDKDGASLREALTSLDQLYQYFISMADENGKMLVLLTSASTIPIELPYQGKEWEQFDLKGKNLLFIKDTLLSPLFAYGAGAENFCGMMEESEIFKRILWTPDQSQLEVDIKNILN